VRVGDRLARSQVIRDQVGVLAQPVRVSFDRHDDCVMKQAIEQRGGYHRVAEDV